MLRIQTFINGDSHMIRNIILADVDNEVASVRYIAIVFVVVWFIIIELEASVCTIKISEMQTQTCTTAHLATSA